MWGFIKIIESKSLVVARRRFSASVYLVFVVQLVPRMALLRLNNTSYLRLGALSRGLPARHAETLLAFPCVDCKLGRAFPND